MTIDTLKSYQVARQQKRADALSAYRKFVRKLASAPVDKVLFDAADAILSPLDLSEIDLGRDVEVMREHARCQAEVDRLSGEPRPNFQQQQDELTKRIREIDEQMLTGPRRILELHGEKRRISSMASKAGNEEHRLAKRLTELRQKNPRLFG